MTEGLTVAGQAERLCLDEDTIRSVIVDYLLYDLHDDTLPDEVVDEIDNILNPGCCRTVPELYPDLQFDLPERDGLCRCVALGGREHRPGPGCPGYGEEDV